VWENRIYISSGDLEGYSLFQIYKATMLMSGHFRFQDWFSVSVVLWSRGNNIVRNEALRLSFPFISTAFRATNFSPDLYLFLVILFYSYRAFSYILYFNKQYNNT